MLCVWVRQGAVSDEYEALQQDLTKAEEVTTTPTSPGSLLADSQPSAYALSVLYAHLFVVWRLFD